LKLEIWYFPGFLAVDRILSRAGKLNQSPAALLSQNPKIHAFPFPKSCYEKYIFLIKNKYFSIDKLSQNKIQYKKVTEIGKRKLST
jgi:hypothetical protein